MSGQQSGSHSLEYEVEKGLGKETYREEKEGKGSQVLGGNKGGGLQSCKKGTALFSPRGKLGEKELVEAGEVEAREKKG